jgi:2-oxoglutarate dehydrogenase E2 component (dihydrolipoamide succinyltransferase)
MPQMGVSVAEGTIVEWRKSPGDSVEADETLADVTTDKVDVEIPCPESGKLGEILVETGETVSVGTPIATIQTGEAPAPRAEPIEPAEAETGQAPDEADRSKFFSPVVRRIADEHGVDLAKVEGTGIGGRVRKRDVVAFIDNGEPEAPAERPLHTESPYKPEPVATNGAASANGSGAEHREPMSAMRQAIARHMVDSRRTAAHCTTIVEVDFSRVAAARAALKEEMGRRGVSLTYLAFVAQATVEALREFPILNASLDGEEVVYHDDVNLGIAVALEEGLIVPVIPKAQRLSLEGMAASISEVAERARSGALEPDDVHGGTFTITNPGQFGAVLATPIINQPQVGILDLEAIVKRPVVVDDDAIAIRPMGFLPLSFDHRALDGATAARFLARIRERLEGWEAS